MYAQLEVPRSEPVNSPENEPVNEPVELPIITIDSFPPTDFFMKAKPSCVFKAISPKSNEPVSGILPGTALRRSLRNWLDICLVYIKYILARTI